MADMSMYNRKPVCKRQVKRYKKKKEKMSIDVKER